MTKQTQWCQTACTSKEVDKTYRWHDPYARNLTVNTFPSANIGRWPSDWWEKKTDVSAQLARWIRRQANCMISDHNLPEGRWIPEDSFSETDGHRLSWAATWFKYVRSQYRPLQRKMVISRNSPVTNSRTKLISYPKEGQCQEPRALHWSTQHGCGPCSPRVTQGGAAGGSDSPGLSLMFDSLSPQF